MNRFTLLILLSVGTGMSQTIPVPSNYQDLYNTLNTQITSFDSAVRSRWNGTSSGVIFAPQLETANAANFTVLLGPTYYSNAVLPELDQLKALGSQGVEVHISFPILDPNFYASNPAQYQQFVSFYQQLATDIRARGMKVLAEATVENQFPGDNVASFTSYYNGLSWNDYMTARARNAVNVATLIQPDYLSVITEPDAEASYTGQTNAGTASGATELLQTMLTALHGAGVKLPIGAGVGTWISNLSQYIQNFSSTSVQYIDLHVFPINQKLLMNALSAADQAHAAGKQVAMSQTWDFKVRDSELPTMSLLQESARDPFTFWQPVDSEFLWAMADFANCERLLFISPFWSRYLHAYIDYNAYGSLPDATVYTDGGIAAINAEQTGRFSATGQAWKNRILPAPDTTPPAVPAPPTASGIYPMAIMLDWTPAIDNVGPAGYLIFRNGQLIDQSTRFTYFDQNLTPGATYSYNVVAFDASGNISAASAPLQVETINTTPASVPANLKLVSAKPTSISISWSQSTGIGGVAGYWVLSGTSLASLHYLAKATGTSYTFPYARSGGTYYFAVESINPLGIVSLNSNVLSVKAP